MAASVNRALKKGIFSKILEFFGRFSGGFSPEIDPGTPLDGPGAPRTSICTKNQPRRPILRPFRGVFPSGRGGGIFLEAAI